MNEYKNKTPRYTEGFRLLNLTKIKTNTLHAC